jgi:hypothetical protein
MSKYFSLLCVMILSAFTLTGARAADVAPVYELRIYATHPGKMPDLLKRFREHTCALFEKHGMKNLGYWVPVEQKDGDKLCYVLEHRNREAAQASWKAFMADPAWNKVRTESEAAGPIVSGVEATFLALTDYSPAVPVSTGRGHVFELRTYHCNEGKLAALDARFRNHTLKLFEKHGMTNLPYWHPTDADKGAGKTLIYLLVHASPEAAKKSFETFRADPEWIKVREESEKDGKFLVSPPGSLFLKPVDFSVWQ